MEKATFAAGCFWGVEEVFRNLDGVISTKVGYIGGNYDNPSYEDVCSGKTNHAEAVEIEFNSNIISYETLLDIFWKMHNPTTLNRQGPDIGTQYRSAIFYHNNQQKETAEMSKRVLEESGIYKDPIVTEIKEATTFWVAEEYHQKYLMKKGMNSCHN